MSTPEKPVFVYADDEVTFLRAAQQDLGREWRVIACKDQTELDRVLQEINLPIAVGLLDVWLPKGENENTLSPVEWIERLRARGAQVGLISAGWGDEYTQTARVMQVPFFEKHEGIRFENVVGDILRWGNELEPGRVK